MRWLATNQCDPLCLKLADRHYSRQKPGSDRFMPPGRMLVLRTVAGDAVWGTAWPFAQYVNREWPDAMLCSIFRNESPELSSELVREALACTHWKYPELPPNGMITMINEGKVRRKRDPGRCFRKAGFEPCGRTKGGLLVLQCSPENWPEPEPPLRSNLSLVD